MVNSNYVSQSSLYVYQLGHIVIIQGKFTTGASTLNGAAYFTIPSSIGVPIDAIANKCVEERYGSQSIGMHIPPGSNTIYLAFSGNTNTTYYMSWIYYTSTY